MTDRSRDNLLRLAEVKVRTSLSRTTIYRRIAAGTFPAATPISEGLVACTKLTSTLGWQIQWDGSGLLHSCFRNTYGYGTSAAIAVCNDEPVAIYIPMAALP